MTVLVWDGKTLATDGAATDGRAKWPSTKAWRHGGVILSGAGPLQAILEMRDWYRNGARPVDFPNVQKGPSWCHFIVVSKAGLFRYEQSPVPVEHGTMQCAFGEGKEFAYGALAMGATAAQAVEIVNKFCPTCGHGVAEYRIEC